MDKKYQDIHFINNKSRKNVFVLREIEILNMSFKDSYIQISCVKTTPVYGSVIKTIIIPKLEGHSLIID